MNPFNFAVMYKGYKFVCWGFDSKYYYAHGNYDEEVKTMGIVDKVDLRDGTTFKIPVSERDKFVILCGRRQSTTGLPVGE